MKSLIMPALLVAAIATPFTAPHAVTLDEYLEQVRRTHPLFARESLSADVARARLQSLYGREDWVVTASPSFTHQEPLETSPFVPERVDYLQLNGGMGRAIWKNGSRVSVEWTSDVLDQKIPGFSVPTPAGVIDVPVGPSTFYTNMLRATYSLPLLRNRGGALDRLDAELAAYDVDLAAVRAAENEEALLLEAADTFLEWAFADEQLRIGRERLALAEEELDRTRKKRKAYLVDEADVLRAEDAVYLTRSAIRLVESRWKSLQAELAALAGWADERQDAPAIDLYEESERPRLDAVDDAIAHTRTVRAIDLQRAQLAAAAGGLDDAARPELSLNLSGALLGGDNEFGGSLEMTHPDVSVGLELRYPIGNRTANANIEETRLRERQLELARREAQVTMSSGMRAIVVQLDELTGLLELNRERIDTARKKTEEELALYNQGRGDLTFVIQSRDNEAGAKLAYAEHALLYHRLLLQYSALADQLLSEDTTD